MAELFFVFSVIFGESMKNLKIILMATLILGGCGNNERKVSEYVQKDHQEKTLNIVDERCQLISSSSVFLMDELADESSLYFKTRNQFIKKYKSEKYDSGILTVKTVHLTDPCGGEVGAIKFENDSIKLLTRLTTEMTCNTQELYIFTYKIKTDKKYPVVF